MAPAHIANLAVHVAAGTLAICLGFYVLTSAKNTARHQRLGRTFGYLTAVVCISAAIGSVFFRFVPVFAVLSVLVPYQLAGGWRAVYTRDRGPALVDAIGTVITTGASVLLLSAVQTAPSQTAVVVYSSLGALFAVLLYDGVRWLFPRRWWSSLWKYEHSYKLVASLFAMLSALAGNAMRFGQPWSQLLPSAAGLMVIGYYFHRLHGRQRRPRVLGSEPNKSPKPTPLRGAS